MATFGIILVVLAFSWFATSTERRLAKLERALKALMEGKVVI